MCVACVGVLCLVLYLGADMEHSILLLADSCQSHWNPNAYELFLDQWICFGNNLLIKHMC